MHPWEAVWNVNWMVVSWIVTLALLGVLAWAVIKGITRHKPRESPKQILERRYARGELDRETYLRMLSELESRKVE